jgi:hypothetical protein
MCTVTWLFDNRGDYHLFCSRDEKHNRAVADPPTNFYRDGVRYIAPRDPDCGGTWISVNEAAVSLCLLNGVGGRGLVSRGLLVVALANSVSQREAVRRVRAVHLNRFAPFQLAVLEPACQPLLLEWNGAKLRTIDDASSFVPLTSSSHDPELVRNIRTACFQYMSPESVPAFASFHRSHEPAAGPYSVCMHRDDASTVSFTEVTVSGGSVSMAYYAGPPCEHTRPVVRQIYVPVTADCVVHAGQ